MTTEPREPGAETAVSASAPLPGKFTTTGRFFDLSGNELIRAKARLTPKEAQQHVVDGALIAFEGCGCGGAAGCVPRWYDEAVLRATRPRFVKGHGSPTWIDLWRGGSREVIFAHGDVEWGGIIP